MLSESVKERVDKGMKYIEYTRLILSKIENYQKSLDPDINMVKLDLIRLNNARSSRIDKTFLPDEDTINLIKAVIEKQTWLIITEPWCGDSAQNIPYISAITAHNPLIDLKLILRDENPDIMDLFLTNGTRSIPILIAFDEQWNELFRWGPRTQTAKELVTAMKNNGAEKKEINEKLHTWYARDKGKDLISEISEILRTQLTQEVV